MSKKNKKNESKKNPWVMKFVVIAIIMLIASIIGGKSIPSLPNILGVIYIIFGLVWFFMHTRVNPEK